jgi:hypothetical protein
MSVGDVKGFRRRMKVLAILGHAPKPSGLSVSESIAREREAAARAAKSAVKKKK